MLILLLLSSRLGGRRYPHFLLQRFRFRLKLSRFDVDFEKLCTLFQGVFLQPRRRWLLLLLLLNSTSTSVSVSDLGFLSEAQRPLTGYRISFDGFSMTHVTATSPIVVKKLATQVPSFSKCNRIAI